MSSMTTADYLAQHGEALEAAISTAVQKAIASRAADPVAYVARELTAFIRDDCRNPEAPIAVTGTSLGAFYSANFAE